MDDASQSPQPEPYCAPAQRGDFISDQNGDQRSGFAPLARTASETDRFDHPLPAQSIHFAVPPQRTLTWRVDNAAAVRVHGAMVWITRARSPYDHWLRPGETLRLERNERIWLSTEAATPARVTITTTWRPPFASVKRLSDTIGNYVARLFDAVFARGLRRRV